MRQNSSQQIRSNRSDQKSGGSTVPGLKKQEYPPTNYLQRWGKRKKEEGRVGLYKEIRKGWGQSQVSEGPLWHCYLRKYRRETGVAPGVQYGAQKGKLCPQRMQENRRQQNTQRLLRDQRAEHRLCKQEAKVPFLALINRPQHNPKHFWGSEFFFLPKTN